MPLSPQRLEFDLYLDESGSFMETSTDPAERRKAAGQNFPSQVVGFLAPSGDNRDEALKVMQACHDAAGLTMGTEFHSNKLRPKTILCPMVPRLVAELKSRGWQPVRLVNKEKVSYGDRVQIYTNMVAELVLRIFLHNSKFAPDAEQLIRLKYASVQLEEDRTKPPVFINMEEYRARMDEYIGRAIVWRGLASKSPLWRVTYSYGSGTRRSELQICDLLSYMSLDDYALCEECGGEAKQLLRGAFKDFNYSMVLRETLERVDGLMEEFSYGAAIILLAEKLAADNVNKDGEFKNQLLERLESVLDRLIEIGARGRDPQMLIIVSWLDQLIGQQRTLAVGYNLTQWLQRNVASRLTQKLGQPQKGTVDWFAYTLHRWGLTAANHQGRLFAAQKEAEALKGIGPALAHRAEHMSLLMDGLVAQSVHRTDCFDFDSVAAQMRFVANSMGALARVFENEMPFSLPLGVRFDLRAKALGTWCQSEIIAGLSYPHRLKAARALSDEAIDEFAGTYDKIRQYQYRCQLEAADGDFQTARSFLALSLHPEESHFTDYSHGTIAGLIESFPEPGPRQGFAILHWLRIGSFICLSDDVEERLAFWGALNSSSLLKLSWCLGAERDYPAHGILRRLALIYATERRWGDALAALNNLIKLNPASKKQVVLATILCAAQAEVGGLLYASDQSRSLRLLDNRMVARPGLSQTLTELRKLAEGVLPTLWGVFEPWQTVIDEITRGHLRPAEVRDKLISLARAVGH